MKAIRIIALNTYLEIIRDRILYGLGVFVILLIGLSLALGQLSYDEQTRISANFGLFSIHLSAVILSIFIGSTLVRKEIDKQTILTLLVRPVTRFQFILGKSVGLFAVVLTTIFCLAFILMIVFWGLGVGVHESFFVALLGVFLESMILLGVTMMFSSFASPFLTVSFALGFFVIGHWIDSLQYFGAQNPSFSFKVFSFMMSQFFPNLEQMNWRSHAIYGDFIDPNSVALISIYSLVWFIIFIATTAMIFRRKEFG